MHVQCTMQTKLNLFLKIIDIQPCIHSKKMLNKTKKLLHEQIWVPPCAPCYKNVQVKKKLMEMVNVYSLSDLVREEEVIQVVLLLLLLLQYYYHHHNHESM